MKIDRFFFRIWIVWGLFSIIFILAAFLFYSNHKVNELEAFYSNSQLELNFLKKAVKNSLQKGNYQNTIQLIDEWGELNANIYAIELLAENGFKIAQYQRDMHADKTVVNSAMINYSYRGNAKLQIIHDLYPVYLLIEDFALKLGVVSFFGIFTSLIFVNQFILLHRRNTALNEETQRLAAAQNELGKSEQLLQNVIVGANLGFWDWYYQTGELRESDRLLSILGLARSEIKYNINDCFERIHVDDLNRVHQVIETAIEQDVPYRVEFRMHHKDGSWVWIEGSGRVIERDTETGNPLRLCGTNQDITARKEAEQALRRTQKMDAIGQLTGGIAHDFNNLLGIIIGNLDFLKRLVSEDEKSLKRVESASKATLRAADLTRQLLGFSRKQAQETLPTDINQMIRGMDSLITRSVTPEVEVELHLTDTPWLTHIDPGDLEDALLNLILNARDAMPQGGKLTIETSNRYFDSSHTELNPAIISGDYLQLAVSDTGCGIAKENLEQIFEPFFSSKSSDKGTGLGLSMVYGFIQRSGGYVKVYSEIGIGTTIRLYLPRTTESGRESEREIHQEVNPLQGNESILVVDDETDLLDLAREYLLEAGFKVHTAVRGAEALAIIESGPAIDLLFSDVVMPGGMNGYELAELACQRNQALKVLLTSGFTQKAAAKNGQSCFAANLLSKPYSRIDLIMRIRDILDGEKQ